MKTHEIKSWPEFFQALWDGSKKFEIRFDDRDYQVGDVLLIKEWDDRKSVYTGRTLRRRITYKLEGIGGGAIAPYHGLVRGYAGLSLADE